MHISNEVVHMLEFVILGQIPGTNIQLTFTDVILGAALLALIAWSLRHFSSKHRTNKTLAA